jgi:hypothetical protein
MKPWSSWAQEKHYDEAIGIFLGHRGTGFAGPLVAPP